MEYVKLKPNQFKHIKFCLVSLILLLFCFMALDRFIEMKKAIIITSIGVLSMIIIAFRNVKIRKYSCLMENFIRSNNLLQVYYNKLSDYAWSNLHFFVFEDYLFFYVL